MRKFISILLLLCLLLTGCGNRIKEPVTFYYIRTSYQEDMQSILATEERESTGHRQDLSYLMALYFMGPANEDLTSPIPRGVNLLHVSMEGSVITLELTDTENTMTESQFSLACACLSLTCLDMTLAESVTIVSGNRSVTMTAENLVLLDSSTQTKESS